MTGKTLLLVEDDLEVQDFNTQLLEHEGFGVVTAATLTEARELLENGSLPDAIILDIGMPDGSGLNFLQTLRKTSKIPVLMLTGYTTNEDVVQGFQSGCDDYLTKPYDFNVLLMRILRLLTRAEQVPDKVAKGRLILYPMSNQAFVNDKDLLLAEKEFNLLLLFTQLENQVISVEYLYEKIWKLPMVDNSSAVRKTVSRLRDKLENSGCTINTERGGGYSFTSKQDMQ